MERCSGHSFGFDVAASNLDPQLGITGHYGAHGAFGWPLVSYSSLVAAETAASILVRTKMFVLYCSVGRTNLQYHPINNFRGLSTLRG